MTKRWDRGLGVRCERPRDPEAFRVDAIKHGLVASSRRYFSHYFQRSFRRYFLLYLRKVTFYSVSGNTVQYLKGKTLVQVQYLASERTPEEQQAGAVALAKTAMSRT